MKKTTKKLALQTETVRVLDREGLEKVVGGNLLTILAPLFESNSCNCKAASNSNGPECQ